MRRLIPILLAVGLLAAWAMPVAALSPDELFGEGCLWGEDSPSTCEFVATGSEVVASTVEIHTESNASVTTTPRLSFSITAEGEGTVSAGMEVRAVRGLEGGTPGAVETFSDHATASGVWTFAKTMSYNAAATLPTVMPEPWYLVP